MIRNDRRVTASTLPPNEAIAVSSQQPPAAVGIGPSSAKRETKMSVAPPQARATQDIGARIAILDTARRGIANTLRAYPLDGEVVATAFARKAERMIVSIVDAWADEVRGIGFPAEPLLEPVVWLAAHGRGEECVAELPRKLAGNILDAVAALQRARPQADVVALVTRIGDIVTRANVNTAAQELSACTARIERLHVSPQERQAVARLCESAAFALRLCGGERIPNRADMHAFLAAEGSDIMDALVLPMPADADAPQVRWRLDVLCGRETIAHLDPATRDALVEGLATITDPSILAQRARQLRDVLRPLLPRAIAPECVRACFTLSDRVTPECLAELVRLPDFTDLSVSDQQALIAGLASLPAVPAPPRDLRSHWFRLVSQLCLTELSPRGQDDMRNGLRALVPFSASTELMHGVSMDAEITLRQEGDTEIRDVRFRDGTTTRVERKPGKALAADAAIAALAQLPRLLRQNLPLLVLTDATRLTDDGTVIMDASVERVTAYEIAGRLSPDDVRNTLIHELGHELAFAQFGMSAGGPGWQSWMEAMAADPITPSIYAAHSVHDDFAEALVLYLGACGTDQEAYLRALYAGRFAALDAIFTLEKTE